MRKSFILLIVSTQLVTGAARAWLPTSQARAMTYRGEPAQTQTRVLGEVTAIDASAKKLELKDLKGQTIAIVFDEKTVYLRVPPGATTLDQASKITFGEVGVGDRVRARGLMDKSATMLLADTLVVLSKAELMRKYERDRAEWIRRGIVGIVKAVNSETNEITLTDPLEGNKTIVLTADARVRFRRYAPDSVRFRDARQSSLAEVKVGDQLRALGDKNADGTRFISEEIVFGTFRTVGGTITNVNRETGEIKINDIQSKQPLTVVVTADSTVRRLPPALVKLLEASVSGKPAESSATDRANSSDLQARVDASPAITLADLKPGDGILVSSSAGKTADRVAAVLVAAGVEDFLKRQIQQPGQRPLNLGLGLPAGSLP